MLRAPRNNETQDFFALLKRPSARANAFQSLVIILIFDAPYGWAYGDSE
jgi:hypothetical protein